MEVANTIKQVINDAVERGEILKSVLLHRLIILVAVFVFVCGKTPSNRIFTFDLFGIL